MTGSLGSNGAGRASGSGSSSISSGGGSGTPASSAALAPKVEKNRGRTAGAPTSCRLNAAVAANPPGPAGVAGGAMASEGSGGGGSGDLVNPSFDAANGVAVSGRSGRTAAGWPNGVPVAGAGGRARPALAIGSGGLESGVGSGGFEPGVGSGGFELGVGTERWRGSKIGRPANAAGTAPGEGTAGPLAAGGSTGRASGRGSGSDDAGAKGAAVRFAPGFVKSGRARRRGVPSGGLALGAWFDMAGRNQLVLHPGFVHSPPQSWSLQLADAGACFPSGHRINCVPVMSEENTSLPVVNGGAMALPWAAPATRSIDSAASERIMSALPEEAFQLIVREAYLFRAGEIIMTAQAEAKAKKEEVQATRPPFLILRRSETKDAFQTSLAAADDDFSLFDKAARRNADAMKKLRKFAELHLEACLRENDPVYYSGLISESLVADWHRCVSRLESNLTDFISEVGSARNSLVNSQLDQNGVRIASDVSGKAILRAAELGGLLAGEIAATTKLADERDQQLQGTAFAAEFPRLPAFDYGGTLREAVNLPVALLQEQFTLILQQCDQLRDQGLPQLLEKVKAAETQHTAVKESYLLGVWQALREYALEHYVQNEDLQEVAKATEAMFTDGITS